MLRFFQGLVPGVLAMIAAATAALSVFIKVAEEVLEGDTHNIDTRIIMVLRAAGNPADPLGPPWLEEAIRDITALGSPVVLGLFVVITALFLLLSGRRRLALFMLVATLGGTALVNVLKAAVARPRPELIPDGILVYTASFPSGHAMLSAVVYLTLGALIARLVPGKLLKLYIMAVAAVLTGLVGFSRVYLGVHWPSDVLAGWAIGAAWAFGGGAWAQIARLDKDVAL